MRKTTMNTDGHVGDEMAVVDGGSNRGIRVCVYACMRVCAYATLCCE